MYERMLDGQTQPSYEEFTEYCGERKALLEKRTIFDKSTARRKRNALSLWETLRLGVEIFFKKKASLRHFCGEWRFYGYAEAG